MHFIHLGDTASNNSSLIRFNALDLNRTMISNRFNVCSI